MYYSREDLIRARRPHADRFERDEAFCTLGRLELEQREAPTADRPAIIAEVKAHIDAFDGANGQAETPQHPADGGGAAPATSATLPDPVGWGMP